MSATERVVIRALRAGIVPSRAVEQLSVGLAEARETILARLRNLNDTGESPPLLVRGEWGSGKTHLLSFIRSLAGARGTASAYASLNARATPLTHPQRILPALARSVAPSPMGSGLTGFLLECLAKDSTRARLERFALTPEAGSLAGPLRTICQAWVRDPNPGIADHPAIGILLGNDLSWADYSYKRRQALERIQSLALMTRSLGFHGLVIALDELETADQLWNIRSRMAAYAVLGTFCRMRAVWTVLGVTERFNQIVSRDLDRARAYSPLDPAAAWFLDRWRRGEFEVLTPPTLGVSDARSLARKVRDLYLAAYPVDSESDDVITPSVAEWGSDPTRNPRRLMRLVVNRLDHSRAW